MICRLPLSLPPCLRGGSHDLLYLHLHKGIHTPNAPCFRWLDVSMELSSGFTGPQFLQLVLYKIVCWILRWIIKLVPMTFFVLDLPSPDSTARVYIKKTFGLALCPPNWKVEVNQMLKLVLTLPVNTSPITAGIYMIWIICVYVVCVCMFNFTLNKLWFVSSVFLPALSAPLTESIVKVTHEDTCTWISMKHTWMTCIPSQLSKMWQVFEL